MPETDRPAPRMLHAAGGLSLHLTPGEGAASLVILAPDAAAVGWAGRLSARLGQPALVLQATGGAFPAVAIDAALPHLRVALGEARVVVAIGAGAAAAPGFAAAVGATGVLALAPRPAPAAEVPAAAAPPPGIIAFDPRAAAQADLAAALAAAGMFPAPIPHAGGALAEVLLGGGAMGDAIAALLAGDAPRAAMALRVARLAAPRLRAGLVARLGASGHPRLAEAVAALARRPAGAESQADARVRVLQRLGRHQEAAGLIGDWIRRQPRQALPRRRMAASLVAMGQRGRAVLALRAALGLGPLPVALHARLVRLLLRLRRREEAVQAAEAARAALPGSAAVEALLGEALLAAGRKDEAAAAFARAQVLDPADAAARRGLAVAADPGGRDDAPGPRLADLLADMEAAGAPEADWHALVGLVEDQDRPVASLAVAARAAAAVPSPGLLARLAQLRLAAGDAAGAEAAWRRVTEVAPAQAAGWLGLADLLAGQKRQAEAAAVAAEGAARCPDDPRMVLRSGALFLAAGDPLRAERTARHVVTLDPREEAGHLLLAEALWRQHRGRDAVRAAAAGLEAMPGSMAIGTRLGFLHLMQDAPAEAAEAFRAVTRQPNAAPQVWLGLTDALWRAGQVEQAEAAAREGLAAYPRNLELRTRLGQLLLAGGDAEAAQAALAEVVAEDPASEVVQLAMADALWRQGRRAEALAAARECAAASPDQPAVAARLGHLLLETGDVNEAAAQFERAIALQPDLVPAWTGLCDAERARKRVKPAIEAYRRAEALGMDRVTRRMLRFRLFGELEE